MLTRLNRATSSFGNVLTHLVFMYYNSRQHMAPVVFRSTKNVPCADSIASHFCVPSQSLFPYSLHILRQRPHHRGLVLHLICASCLAYNDCDSSATWKIRRHAPSISAIAKLLSQAISARRTLPGSRSNRGGMSVHADEILGTRYRYGCWGLG